MSVRKQSAKNRLVDKKEIDRHLLTISCISGREKTVRNSYLYIFSHFAML